MLIVIGLIAGLRVLGTGAIFRGSLATETYIAEGGGEYATTVARSDRDATVFEQKYGRDL